MRVYLVQLAAVVATWFTVDACLAPGTRPWASAVALAAAYVLSLVVIPFAQSEGATDA